jgi:anti-anti-sigma factor
LQLLPLLAQSVSPARLVVDMSNVKYIGSALIGKFLGVSRILAARNGSFGLVNMNGYCRTVISLTKLARFLPRHDSLEEVTAVV